MRNLFVTVLVLSCINIFSQQRSPNQNLVSAKITMKGKIIEKQTKQNLEYATIVLQHVKTKILSGGITDQNGDFSFEANSTFINLVLC